ncbi:MAG TPA: Crp/Fnr family transcriptional regulator [Niastella sp.]|nr:Crp/Fnr family transcriptional regulator [Niastella sp.]
MFTLIKQSLKKIMPSMTEEEMISFISRLESRTIAKHEFFVREGQVANEMAVVFKGAFRMYFTYKERKQTGHFMFEGQWIGDYESFLSRKPAANYIEALEDSEVLCLSYDNMQAMYNMGAQYERFGRLIAEYVYLVAMNSYKSLLLKTAEERYLELLETQPHILERLPQHYIASYLGIQAPSLSRIRNKLAQKH